MESTSVQAYRKNDTELPLLRGQSHPRPRPHPCHSLLHLPRLTRLLLVVHVLSFVSDSVQPGTEMAEWRAESEKDLGEAYRFGEDQGCQEQRRDWIILPQ